MKYEATIKLPKNELCEYEDMFSYTKEDLIRNKITFDENINTFTAIFDNGFEVDVKINASEDDVWSEAVLYDNKDGTCCITDVCDSLGGDWSFKYGNDEYIVNVVGV